jgi:hypothetical protein
VNNRKSGEELVNAFEEAVLDYASYGGDYSPINRQSKDECRKKLDRLRKELIEVCDYSKEED